MSKGNQSVHILHPGGNVMIRDMSCMLLHRQFLGLTFHMISKMLSHACDLDLSYPGVNALSYMDPGLIRNIIDWKQAKTTNPLDKIDLGASMSGKQGDR